MSINIRSKHILMMALLVSGLALWLVPLAISPVIAQTTNPTPNVTFIEFVGTIETLNEASIVVNGQVIDTTLLVAPLDTPLTVGAAVRVRGVLLSDGRIAAQSIISEGEGIGANESEIIGTIERINGAQLVVNGQTVNISQAELDGLLMVGAQVRVIATLSGTTWQARTVQLLAPGNIPPVTPFPIIPTPFPVTAAPVPMVATPRPIIPTPGAFVPDIADGQIFILRGTLERVNQRFVVVSGFRIPIDADDVRGPLVRGALVEVALRSENGILSVEWIQLANPADFEFNNDDDDNESSGRGNSGRGFSGRADDNESSGSN